MARRGVRGQDRVTKEKTDHRVVMSESERGKVIKKKKPCSCLQAPVSRMLELSIVTVFCCVKDWGRCLSFNSLVSPLLCCFVNRSDKVRASPSCGLRELSHCRPTSSWATTPLVLDTQDVLSVFFLIQHCRLLWQVNWKYVLIGRRYQVASSWWRQRTFLLFMTIRCSPAYLFIVQSCKGSLVCHCQKSKKNPHTLLNYNKVCCGNQEKSFWHEAKQFK